MVPPAFTVHADWKTSATLPGKKRPLTRANGRSDPLTTDAGANFLHYANPCGDDWPLDGPAEGIWAQFPTASHLMAAL